MDSTPSFWSRRTPRRTASSSSARTTLPSKSQRSGMGMRARRRAMGSGGGEAGSQISLVVPAQLDLVAVPLGGQHSGQGAAHLDHRVVGRRRAVHEGFNGRTERGLVEAEAGGQLARCR